MSGCWAVWDVPMLVEAEPRHVRDFQWRWTAAVFVWRVQRLHRRHGCCHEGLLWQYRVTNATEVVDSS